MYKIFDIQEVVLTFHEKLAWVMAVATGLVGVWYGQAVIVASREIEGTIGPSIALISFSTITLVLAAIISSIVFSIADDATDPGLEDERDRSVFSRAGNWSGWVLAACAIGALWHYYFHADGNALFHLVVGAMFVATVVDFALQIALYRRGG